MDQNIVIIGIIVFTVIFVFWLISRTIKQEK